MIKSMVNSTSYKNNMNETSETIKYTVVVYVVFATVFGSIGCYLISRWKLEKSKILPI